MGFDAHIGEHSAKDYFADSTLAQLKYEVVCFWSPDAMWRDNDGLAILYIGLETLQPVSARADKAIKIQDSFSGEQAIVELLGFQRSVEFPSLVDGKEIVGRNEDFEIVRFRGLEDTLHVFDGVVFFETLVQKRPGFSRLAKNFILGVDECHRRIGIVNFHSYVLTEIDTQYQMLPLSRTTLLDSFLTPKTPSLAALATLNLTTVLAGILIFCCVFGLKPVCAFLFCFTSLPKPGKTNSPFFLIAL